MKKFFTAAAVALAICATGARAAAFQSDGVRVGPVAEDKETYTSDAPAPKKDEKKSAPTSGDKNNNSTGPSNDSAATRGDDKKKEKRASEKTASEKPAAEKTQAAPLTNSTASTNAPAAANKPSATSDAPPKSGANATVPTGAKVGSDKKNSTAVGADSDPPPTAPRSNPPVAGPSAASAPLPTANDKDLTAVYRIGTGDVLDIRMLNDQDPRQSTLYTVLAGGVLDYPLLRDPLTVAGMTTDELAAQLIADFRHRGIYQHPQVRVSVREYASHAVLVSGLAGDPGTKILRREAIPLYVVVAEAQPKPEAGRAVVIAHATGKVTTVDLNDAAGLNMLVQAGDVVNLTARPPEFFYIGGEVSAPGQKDFHVGMTLTQAVLASGGLTRNASGKVKVSRAGADGRLSSTEYVIAEIEGGRVPDPVLQAGDRIEAARRK
jgi:protein involved in polysaccharide export with SLBB domain